MADLDFMEYKRIVLKSDQEARRCQEWLAWRNRPRSFPKGESKSNGKVERAVHTVHGFARTLKDFLEQQSGITLES